MLRAKQINKEIIITLILYIFYFGWWYYFAYLHTDSEDVKNFKYILGLPEWFFYSCVLGLIVINILVFIVVTFFFKNTSLEEEEEKC
ncbi:MAG: YhdT family protein [Fusobacterium sp.]|nr:YhdT family protein [Fusobacterium sp.]MDO5788347.1 YhdT family protein [Fusobacterium sp.]